MVGLERTRALGALALAGVVAMATAAVTTEAADHNDPRRVQEENEHYGDPAADLADIFAWHDVAQNKLVTIVTWRVEPGYQLNLDDRLRYGIHIDNDDDHDDDINIYIQYGRAAEGEGWGMRLTGLPGVGKSIVTPVGETMTVDGVNVLSGLFDDPFFFDLDGFLTGLSHDGLGNPILDSSAGHQRDLTRPFGFKNDNDTFAGTNVHAVVIEMPLDRILVENKGGYEKLNIWADSAQLATRRDEFEPTPRGQ